MILSRDGKPLFPLGMYELPRTDDEWRAWSDAGINLVRCGSRDDLDRAEAFGMFGWVPVSMILADDDDGSALAAKINELKGHSALALWEAPDEAIWNAWRLDDDGRPVRLRHHSDATRAELGERMDAVVRGLERGVELIGRLDPGRATWLNEASMSDYDSLARCLPWVDVVGCDYYPVPNHQSMPMEWTGAFTERFRQTAPTKDVWMVLQAFSWSSLFPDRGLQQARPSTDECRFMAWQAIARGATGLFWWGSSSEDRPAPHLDGLMSVVAEFRGLHPFLFAGDAPSVKVTTDERRFPAAMGVSRIARRSGDSTLLALVNQDPYEHDAIISGLDWVGDPNSMRTIAGPDPSFERTAHGCVTTMDAYEVRVYVTG
jgi:hypothetical protein